jgi:hypothetical protein
MRVRTALCRAVAACAVLGGLPLGAQAPSATRTAAAPALQPYVYEFYYKVKWGALEEWLDLYKKNHYPILLRLKEQGKILSMSAATPVDHAGEEKRWDFRFTIVYRDVVAAHDETSAEMIRQMYPDQVAFKAAERRRFELLIEHMDVAVWVDDLASWKPR